jgi:5-methylcytosine-specific restriction endonuclease McrA
MADADNTPPPPKIISRADAKAAGLLRYYTGKPCKRQHVAEHLVTGECVECRKLRCKASWAADREKNSEKRKAKYATEPEYAEKVKARSASYRERHPDEAKASNEKTKAKYRDHYNAAQVARYAADPEKHRARGRAWKAANHERMLEYGRARYVADPEKCRAQARKSAAANPKRVMARAEREKKRADKIAWQAANPEKVLEEKKSRDAAYYAANRERVLTTCAAWRAANLERARAKGVEWRAANPEQVRMLKRISQARRRARDCEAGGYHKAEDIKAIYEMQKGKCAHCKRKVGEDYEVDHIQPLSKGGSNWPANLQILCPKCNRDKGAKDPLEHARKLGLLL